MVYKSREIFLPFFHNPRVRQTNGQNSHHLRFSIRVRDKDMASIWWELRPCLETRLLPRDIGIEKAFGKSSESVQLAMLKACDACADMGQ